MDRQELVMRVRWSAAGEPRRVGGRPSRGNALSGRERVRTHGMSLPDLLLAAILLLPSLVLVLGMVGYPLAYESALSLTDRRVDDPGRVVWLANYWDLLIDGRFWEAVGTTALYGVVAT